MTNPLCFHGLSRFRSSNHTVAMQSTSVYWIAVYDILEQAGSEVYLANARDTKNLPGRKSNVQESQWLMKLHTYGLLRNSFRPSQEVRTMRTYWRQRNDLVRAARHIHRIQKALMQMNIQLANVLSDVSGMTGQAIIKAILAGERDPRRLRAPPARERFSILRQPARFSLRKHKSPPRSACRGGPGDHRVRRAFWSGWRTRERRVPGQIHPLRGSCARSTCR